MGTKSKEKASMFMMKAFEGVWISREIALDSKFTLTEKYLYAFIEALCKRTGRCTASNDYLAGCLEACGAGNSQVTISSGIAKLVSNNYIEVENILTDSGQLRQIKLKERL